MAQPPETRFTRAGDVDIAYQVVGLAGQLDLVFVPGWVSHLEVMWELPEFARFLDRLAAMGRLIMFDKRGTELSDRVAGMATLEQRADDIAAVMDAAGSARAAIIAWGEGAAIAAMFAAAHPDRVAALVLGTLPVKVTDGQRPLIPDPALLRELSAAVETGWGQASLVPLLAPSRADDTRFLSWYRRWERLSSTPSAAAATLRWAMEFDLGPVLPAIQARTLIVHRTGNALFDAESVRAAAKMIPDARCAELPGADELPYVGDSDALLDVIQEFLTGAKGTPDLDRSLPRCCSPTSSARRRKLTSSVTAAGETCSMSTTPASGACWSDSAVPRSIPPGMASLPPSTGPHGPSGPPAPSGTSCVTSALRSGPACTPAKSSAGRHR